MIKLERGHYDKIVHHCGKSVYIIISEKRLALDIYCLISKVKKIMMLSRKE